MSTAMPEVQDSADLILKDPQQAYLIEVGKEPEPIEPKNGKRFGLEECWKILQCDTIQIVGAAKSGMILIVDENGKILGKPKNEIACQLTSHMIVGTVICCPRRMFK